MSYFVFLLSRETLENRKVKQVLSGRLVPGGRGNISKGCRRVEYYTLMYENGKMRPVETIPGMGVGGIKENDGGATSTMVYCKKFCKCYSVIPVQH
jgi:hypothetical protein